MQRYALHSTVSTHEEWRHLLEYWRISGLCQGVRRSIILCHALRYLVENAEVHAFRTSGRYDVGGLDSYLECCEEFRCKSAELKKLVM